MTSFLSTRLAIAMAPPSMHLALLLLSLISLASATPLTVDLGYSVYNGYYNAEFNLNIFKGYEANCQVTRFLC